jgi:hypothetical protein
VARNLTAGCAQVIVLSTRITGATLKRGNFSTAGASEMPDLRLALPYIRVDLRSQSEYVVAKTVGVKLLVALTGRNEGASDAHTV